VTDAADLEQLLNAPREYGVTPLATMAKMSGLDFMQALRDGKLPAPPIMKLMGIALTEVEHGLAVFEAIAKFDYYNPIGSVHGGFIATMMDSALGCCVHTTLPAGQGYTTLEFKVSFIRAVTDKTGPLRVEGRVLNVGRRAATSEARMTDTQGRLLAHATTTCLVFDLPVSASGGK
jgi:uncharacterized protein (TIGR00369 family)